MNFLGSLGHSLFPLPLALGLPPFHAWRSNPKSRKEGKGNVGPSLTGGWTQRMIRQYTVNLPCLAVGSGVFAGCARALLGLSYAFRPHTLTSFVSFGPLAQAPLALRPYQANFCILCWPYACRQVRNGERGGMKSGVAWRIWRKPCHIFSEPIRVH